MTIEDLAIDLWEGREQSQEESYKVSEWDDSLSENTGNFCGGSVSQVNSGDKDRFAG